jgi:hypothetical protein
MELLLKRMFEWMLEDYICRLKFPCTICKYEHPKNLWVFWFHLVYEFKAFMNKLTIDELNHLWVL